MAQQQFEAVQATTDGTWVPHRAYRRENNTIVPFFLWADPETIGKPVQSTAITSPTPGQVITATVVNVRVVTQNANNVTVALDAGAAESMEPLGSGAWVLAVSLEEAANGTHTFVVRTSYADGTSGLATVSFTLNVKPPIPVDPTSPSNLVVITTPNSADLEGVESGEVCMSGSAMYIEGTIHSSIADDVVDAYWQYGALADAPKRPQYGQRHMTRVAGTNRWRLDEPIDTLRYQISTAQIGGSITAEKQKATLSDVWWDQQMTAVLKDGTRVSSKYARVISGNRNPRRVGKAPKFNPLHAFTADYSTHDNFVMKILGGRGNFPDHPDGQDGLLFGRERSGMSIVPDPVPAGTDGHKSHGNVVEAHIPMNYHSLTSNAKESFGGGYYGLKGDQPKDSEGKPPPNPDGTPYSGPLKPVDYPNGTLRWQFVYPARLQEGDEVWSGFALRLDPAFPTTQNHLSLMQVYQDDYRWGLTLMGETKTNDKNHVNNTPDHIRIEPERLNPFERSTLFKMPFYRGKWVDIIRRTVASRDARVGGFEIWTRVPGGKLKQHVWPDGSTFHKMTTLQEQSPTTGGLQIHDHVYFNMANFESKAGTSYVPARAWFAKQKMGGSLEEVDPQSY